MSQLIEVIPKISTPLILAGFTVAVFLFFAIKKISIVTTNSKTSLLILKCFFSIALFSILLGFIGYLLAISVIKENSWLIPVILLIPFPFFIYIFHVIFKENKVIDTSADKGLYPKPREQERGDDTLPKQALINKIELIMEERPLQIRDLSKELGISEIMVGDILNELVFHGRVEKNGKEYSIILEKKLPRK
jgi:hypothetical protein